MKPAANLKRRPTWPVHVGDVTIGGDAPVVLQSMTSTPTNNVEASADQAMRIAAAGGRIVRLTAPGQREAEAIGRVGELLAARGCTVPLVADIHFNPKAAYTAAACCAKVRINPGNFVDPGRTFEKLEFTDSEYADEIKRIDRALVPLIDICKEHGTALRIGVNHGSLSDRIMSRYGDTPAGMAESAMEFLRVCVANDFRQVVISVKASNVTVMVETVRRLVRAMDAENMHFPLHLGVTEAGDGEDARIKSAVGIGSLLADGIGDTIRVSLSEDPELEIPVARLIADYAARVADASAAWPARRRNGVAPQRRPSAAVGIVGGTQVPIVASAAGASGPWSEDATPDLNLADIETSGPVAVLTAAGPGASAELMAAVDAMDAAGDHRPVILCIDYRGQDADASTLAVQAAIDFGRMLLAGYGDGIAMMADGISDADTARTLFAILQSTRQRMTRTEYIACPSCGRTLYDLQHTLRAIKEATASLRGLKIGVMGCIVNGPGEMADADYGYVGAGPGRVSLYKGKTCVVKNIPADEAVDRLVELIKQNGDWR